MAKYFEYETVGGEQQFILEKVENITDNGFCMIVCFQNEDCHFSFRDNNSCCIGNFDLDHTTNFTVTRSVIGNFKKG